MSNKFQRIHQLESAPISVAGAKTFTHEFDGMAGGIDWSKSYYELNFSAKHQTGQPYTQAVELVDPLTTTYYSPSCVIQNVRLQHDLNGVIEEIRNVNVLNQSENYLLNSQAELQTKENEGYRILNTDMNGSGTMIVPCSEILGMGRSAGVFPIDRLGGRCQLRCDLEDRVEYAQSSNPIIGTDATFTLTVDDIAGPAANTALFSVEPVQITNQSAADAFFPAGRLVTLNFTMAGTAASVQVVVSSAVVAGGACTLTFENAWINQTAGDDITGITITLDDVAPIACQAIPAADPPAAPSNTLTAVNKTVDNFVEGASYTCVIRTHTAGGVFYTVSESVLETAVAAAANVVLTFDSNIVNLPATNANNEVKLYLNQTPLRLDFNEINLCLYRVKSASEKYMFTTQTLEKSVIPASTQYINQYTIEGGLTGIKFMVSESDKLVSSLPLATCGTYRISLNNKDTSNRDISINQSQDQEYKDRVKLFYGDSLHNLNRSVANNVANQYSHMVLCEKHLSMPGDLVEIRLNSLATTPVGAVAYLFKDKLMEL